MTWIIRVRSHDDGRIMESASHTTPDAAMDGYRLMLARKDLIGQPLAAVFKPPAGLVEPGNVATYFSRFDREIGRGRIAADDPRLDPRCPRVEAERIAESLPPPRPTSALHNWEADERPLSECLREWQRTRGGREGAAACLRLPLATYHGYASGRPAQQESLIRLAMTLIDQRDAAAVDR